MVEVIDCAFDVDRQIAELNGPIGSARAADAHRAIAAAGKKLLLLDNAPTGMLPGKDYVSVISTDNFGLGQIGAELLAVGLVGVLPMGWISLPRTTARSLSASGWPPIGRICHWCAASSPM
ncbi:hypothetical protein [Terribium terrae]|uniref:hypothetical protein n=1 Tax=Terribium terrae TaxID=2725666 RepID=UPI001246950B|nr:hypothetical protein [Mesorhizobium terrae]